MMTTDPLTQIAAALLGYAGIIDIEEARELAGFPKKRSPWFDRGLADMTKFIKSTGKTVPPVMANWWPPKTMKEVVRRAVS